MTDSPYESVENRSAELFDRYTLPKIALGIILTASLLGTYLSLRLGSGASIGFVLVKWGYLVTVGVLVGGLCWKHLFVRPQDLGTGTAEYCSRMYTRYEYVTYLTIGGLLTTGSVVCYRYWLLVPENVVPLVVTVLLGSLLVVLAVSLFQSGPVEDQFRSLLSLTTFTLAVGLLVATAAAEVSLRSGTVGMISIRTIHLLAFALWLGGAVWNIFVAVPSGTESPTVPVVSAAGQQLERFRWAVRFIIPTLIVTGLYQAVSAFGTSYSVYLQSTLGLAVVAKLGLIGVLVVIFKLCPMWRACSPIDSVCELEELELTEQTKTAEDRSND